MFVVCFFFFQAEDGIRDLYVTGVQTCALPISADWTDHVNPMADGPAGVRAVVETIAERRPGVRFDIDTTLRDGDLVAAAGVASSDVDPPARHLWLFRATGGRLAEMWTFDERQPGA